MDSVGNKGLNGLSGLHEAMGIKGMIVLETINPDGSIGEKVVLNNTTDNLKSAMAGLLAGQSVGIPSYVAIGSGANAARSLASSNADTDATLGVSGQDMLAQEFTDTVSYRVSHVLLWLKRLGTPAGTLTVEIQTNNAGVPSNTAVTNGASATVACSGLSTSYDWVRFDFSTPPILTASTIYHLVLKSSGYTYSAGVTEVSWGIDTSSPGFTGGDFEKASGTTWSAWAVSGDAVFRVISQTDHSYTAILGEITRRVITSRSKQSATIARLLTNFPVGVGTDYIGHVGLYDASSGGNLLAIGTVKLNKLSTQALNIYWLLEII